jgi:hypothetical protein
LDDILASSSSDPNVTTFKCLRPVYLKFTVLLGLEGMVSRHMEAILFSSLGEEKKSDARKSITWIVYLENALVFFKKGISLLAVSGFQYCLT